MQRRCGRPAGSGNHARESEAAATQSTATQDSSTLREPSVFEFELSQE